MAYTRSRKAPVLARIPAALFLFAMIAMSSVPADANVFEWVLFKDHNYIQTANNVRPTTIDLFDYELVLQTDPGDFATVNLLGPGVNIPLTEIDPGEWEEVAFFGTQAALDAAMPSAPTVYSISTSGGTLGSLSENVTMGPDRYPTLAPYVSGNSFNDLSSFDVSQDIIIDFGQPDPGDSQVTAFSFYIVDEINDIDLFTYQEFGTGPYSGSFLLPGGTLDPLTTYTAEMEFSTALQDSVDGFGPVSNFPIAETNFAALTLFEFETAASAVPEPSTVALGLIGGVALCGLAIRRRKR